MRWYKKSELICVICAGQSNLVSCLAKYLNMFAMVKALVSELSFVPNANTNTPSWWIVRHIIFHQLGNTMLYLATKLPYGVASRDATMINLVSPSDWRPSQSCVCLTSFKNFESNDVYHHASCIGMNHTCETIHAQVYTMWQWKLESCLFRIYRINILLYYINLKYPS